MRPRQSPRLGPVPVLLVLVVAVSWWPRPVAAVEPFSAGLAVGAGVMLSALWSARDKVVCQVNGDTGGALNIFRIDLYSTDIYRIICR